MLYLFMKYVSFNKKNILIYLGGVVIIINLLRLFWVLRTNISWTGINGNILLHQDTLLLGVVLAFVKLHFKSIFNVLNTKRFFLFSSFLFLVFMYFIVKLRWPVDRVDDFVFSRTLTFLIGSLTITMMLPYIENGIQPIKIKGLSFLNPVITLGSKYSYALYLFHNMVQVFMEYVFKVQMPYLSIIGAVFLSYLLYEYFEKKFLILRDKYYPEVHPLKL